MMVNSARPQSELPRTVGIGGTWPHGLDQDYLMICTTRGNEVSRGAIAITPDQDSPWADEVGVDFSFATSSLTVFAADRSGSYPQEELISFTYDDNNTWRQSADGYSDSLVPQPELTLQQLQAEFLDDPASWQASPQSMTIGITGGNGMIFIDAIRLYPTAD